jgi:hypothetical protein
MEEKKEKTMQEKMNQRIKLLGACSLLLIVLGGAFALAQASAVSTYWDLRSDDYMDDPTMPFNERENATYTFTDQWLKDTYWRLIWYAVPGLIMYLVGIVVFYTRDLVVNEKEIHKTFCKGEGEKKYCPECGLKLSRLEKK